MTTHKHTIELSGAERAHIQTITRRGKHNSRVINRARVLVYSNAGSSKNAIARVLGIGRSTVQEVRDRYRNGGIDRALYDAPRTGQPRKLSDKAEAHLVALACSDPPEGRERWTLMLLKKKMMEDKKVASISDVCILTYLQRRGIKPWREKNVVRAKDYARIH